MVWRFTKSFNRILSKWHLQCRCWYTALFFKCLPNKPFTFKGLECHGGKQTWTNQNGGTKQWLTILQCTNMSGPDKLLLKSKQPRCFKGVNTLPIDYNSNTKAWMSRVIFKGWLNKLDKKMKSNRRKIILFIDNSSAHNRRTSTN